VRACESHNDETIASTEVMPLRGFRASFQNIRVFIRNPKVAIEVTLFFMLIGNKSHLADVHWFHFAPAKYPTKPPSAIAINSTDKLKLFIVAP
jgi:hypothetical protein